MPKRFYLNDCLPDHPEEGKNVGELFREMVLNYKELHKNELLIMMLRKAVIMPWL